MNIYRNISVRPAPGFWKSVFVCCCLVVKTYLTLCNPMDCSPPGSSVHGISQARILGWVVISYSRWSSQLRDWIYVSCIAGSFFTTEPLGKPRSLEHRKQAKVQDIKTTGEEPPGVSEDGQVMPYQNEKNWNNFVLVGLNLNLETLVDSS